MRPPERIPVILDLLREIWEKNPDLRFFQMIDNCSVDYYTEDLNQFIYELCYTYGMPFHRYCMWGTRGKDGRSPLVYKKMCEFETEHLQSIMKDWKDGEYAVSSYCREAIEGILKERKERSGQKA